MLIKCIENLAVWGIEKLEFREALNGATFIHQKM